MGLRDEQRATARRIIVDAALALFLEHGYGGTTIDDVADRAGVARRTVYNHFSSKAEILLAAIDDRVAGTRVRSQEADHERFVALAQDDPRAALDLLGELTAAIAERSLPLLRLAEEAAVQDGEVAKRLAAQEETRYGAQGFAVRTLADAGHLREDVDLAYLQRGFWLLAGPGPAMAAMRSGWSSETYGRWLAETLAGFLLPPA